MISRVRGRKVSIESTGERLPSRSKIGPIAGFSLLICVELLVISILYNHSFEFECRAKAPAFFCAFLSLGVIRAISVVGAVAVFFTARSGVLSEFLGSVRDRLDLRWVGIQVLGFLLILLPWTFVSDQVSTGVFALGSAIWLLGGALACVGAGLALVPESGWGNLLSKAGLPLLAILLFAGLSPEIAAVFQNIWKFDPLTEVTFKSAEAVLGSMGYSVNSEPPIKLLGISEFNVLVGPQCSGVEGFLLISAFLSFYIWLFKSDLKFPRVWILIPIGLAFSWMFNVVRISTLIMMGHHVSPDLAINGFHSHAGWLMFTIVAVGLAFTAHKIRWFRKSEVEATRAPKEIVPLSEDPYAALILPFIVFMASSLLLSTFTSLPGLYYPIRFVAMFAVLLFFWKFLKSLTWVLDPVSIGVGAVIGVLWLITAPAIEAADTDLAAALSGLSGIAFTVWVITRVIGTSLLVPVIEELFFRGYVQARIDDGSLLMRVLAFAVSSGLFAALHGRWVEAFLAGIAFGLLMLRKGRVTDAILAHMTANAIIAAWALFTKNWSVI